MRITPPADDYGLQRLKQDDSKRQVKAAEKVAAIPAIDAEGTAQEQVQERRQQQRRQRERRRLKAPSPLDSRSHEERRQEQRRQDGIDDDEFPGDSLGRGIDDFA